jgi:carboxypeptidase D
MITEALFALFAATSVVQALVPSSFPHAYPNQPSGEYSPAWQKCKHRLLVSSAFSNSLPQTSNFQVILTEQLPNVTWTLPRNWAGNIPVQRAGHDDDTLFFWAFEHEYGSFTAAANDKPWAIWLNGCVTDKLTTSPRCLLFLQLLSQRPRLLQPRRRHA